jgi:hypothetical protein
MILMIKMMIMMIVMTMTTIMVVVMIIMMMIMMMMIMMMMTIAAAIKTFIPGRPFYLPIQIIHTQNTKCLLFRNRNKLLYNYTNFLYCC